MLLKDFIAQVGDNKAARLFKTKARTAKAWRLGDRTPRTDSIAIILKKSPVTYDGILKSRKAA